MLTYLTNGWFDPAEPQRLRAEVLDGALDSAGILARADVSAAALLTLRRVLVQHGPGHHVQDALCSDAGDRAPDPKARRQMLVSHLADATDGNPALQAFMMDCLESASNAASWRALCGHLEHISLLVATLHAARASRKDASGDAVAPNSMNLDHGRGQFTPSQALRS